MNGFRCLLYVPTAGFSAFVKWSLVSKVGRRGMCWIRHRGRCVKDNRLSPFHALDLLLCHQQKIAHILDYRFDKCCNKGADQFVESCADWRQSIGQKWNAQIIELMARATSSRKWDVGSMVTPNASSSTGSGRSSKKSLSCRTVLVKQVMSSI